VPGRSLQQAVRTAGAGVLLITLAAGASVAVALGGGVAADESAQEEFGFDKESYGVAPPDTAEVGLAVPDGGVFSVIVDAPGEQFSVEVTAGYSPDDADGENPVVLLDTGNVSSDEPDDYLSVTNARVHRITVHEHDIEDGDLPGGQYELRAIRGPDRSVATLDVAPTVSLGFERELSQSDVVRDPVRTVAGETGLAPGEELEIRITSTGRDSFRIVSGAVVAEDGTFETTVDLGPVPAGAGFEVTAHHDGVTRARREVRLLGDLPAPVGGRQVSDGITFAYGGDQLRLDAAAGQAISGETDLGEGEPITVVLRSPESHLRVVTAEVDRYGTFEVTADLGGLQPRSDVIVSAVGDGVSGAAPVAIVDPDTADRGDTTGTVLLDEPGDAGPTPDAGPHLATGALAIALGVVLSVVASGLLLGVDRSLASS